MTPRGYQARAGLAAPPPATVRLGLRASLDGMHERIPARVDVWLVVLAVVAVLAVAAIITPLLRDPDVPGAIRALVGLLALGFVGASLAVTVPVRYAFEWGGVFVGAGFLRIRLAYPDIVVAAKVTSPLSNAAWSWVKVRLVLRQGGAIEIAPRDREAFLAELSRRAPHLREHPRGLRDPAFVRGGGSGSGA